MIMLIFGVIVLLLNTQRIFLYFLHHYGSHMSCICMFERCAHTHAHTHNLSSSDFSCVSNQHVRKRETKGERRPEETNGATERRKKLTRAEKGDGGGHDDTGGKRAQ